jgi:hypothetical protein
MWALDQQGEVKNRFFFFFLHLLSTTWGFTPNSGGAAVKASLPLHRLVSNFYIYGKHSKISLRIPSGKLQQRAAAAAAAATGAISVSTLHIHK